MEDKLNEAIREMEPHLSFRMKDKTYPNTHVGIEFDIEEIREFNDRHIHLYGFMVTANWKGYIKKYTTIKCIFGKEGKEGSPFGFEYYLVEHYGNTVKDTSIEILGMPENEKTIRDIISKALSFK